MVEPDVYTGDTSLDVTDFPNNTIENVLIKANNSGVEVDCEIGNGSATIRNLGIEGPITDKYNHILYPHATGENGVIDIENVFVGGISKGEFGAGNLMFVNRAHEGTLNVSRYTGMATPEYPGEDLIYASPPGNPEGSKAPGSGGTVHLDTVYYKQYPKPEADYGIRLGTGGSTARNVVIDGATVPLANLYAGEGSDTANDSGPAVFENCHVRGQGSTELRIGDHAYGKGGNPDITAQAVVRNVELSNGMDGVGRNRFGSGGRGELLERGNGVGNDPDLTPPDGVPMSAMEAASADGTMPPDEPEPPEQPDQPEQQESSIGDLALLGVGLWYAKKRQG